MIILQINRQPMRSQEYDTLHRVIARCLMHDRVPVVLSAVGVYPELEKELTCGLVMVSDCLEESIGAELVHGVDVCSEGGEHLDECFVAVGRGVVKSCAAAGVFDVEVAAGAVVEVEEGDVAGDGCFLKVSFGFGVGSLGHACVHVFPVDRVAFLVSDFEPVGEVDIGVFLFDFVVLEWVLPLVFFCAFEVKVKEAFFSRVGFPLFFFIV